jgi:hypothetical protein
VLGNMLDFSLDQHGSRFIQLKLDTLGPEDLAAAFRRAPPWHGGAAGRLAVLTACKLQLVLRPARLV